MTVHVSITVLHKYSPQIDYIDTTGGCGLNITNVGATPCGSEIPMRTLRQWR